jgi:RIO-like serine/threonine protein kinase
MATRIELKRGSFGDIYCEETPDSARTIRDLRAASWPGLARFLARREAKALTRLDGIDGVPALIRVERDRLIRSFLAGDVMYRDAPQSPEYFREALRLVRRLHRRRVAHNDLAKEANWIRRDDRTPGIVDFQLAVCFSRRSRLFRMLAREDLRHLLKHKRHYFPEALTARQREILATPMWPARGWRLLIKPGYLFLTRRVLGWPERDSAAERQRPARG